MAPVMSIGLLQLQHARSQAQKRGFIKLHDY